MLITELNNLGAEVTEVDVRALTAVQVAQLKAAFAQHGLLIFRDQDLTEADHIGLAERWGQINTNRVFKAHADYPQIALIDAKPDQVQGRRPITWHTDHSYDQIPASASILVARTLPETGGDTWFASMYRAFDQLSEDLKTKLLTLNAVHSVLRVFGGSGSMTDAFPEIIHPVVVRHPLSGRPVLYVNPGFTIRFDGWTQEESAPLLDYLYQSAVLDIDDTFSSRYYSPPTYDHIERVKWQPGTIAIWDNRATWHFAQNDYPGQIRTMHRITLEGEALQPYQTETV